VTAVATDGSSRAVSGDYNGNIIIWRLSTTEFEAVAYLRGFHEGKIASICIQCGEGRVVSAGEDSSLKVWSEGVEGWGCHSRLEEHTDAIHDAILLPQGKIASASADGSIRIWSLEDGSCEIARMGHDDEVRALAALPDGRIVSASDDATARVWARVEAPGGARAALA